MKRMTLSELQQTELQILATFDETCKSNNLKYSLGYGTLLGSIRHKGFIPWDDDIDIWMPRSEFDKLRGILERTNFRFGQYIFLFPKSDNYFYPYLKIIDAKTSVKERNIMSDYKTGVWIDVFPVDYFADSEKEAHEISEEQVQTVNNYYRYFVESKIVDARSLIKKIYLFIYRKAKGKDKVKLYERLNKYSINSYMKYCGNACWPLTSNDIYPSYCFESYIEGEFEGYRFPILKEYDMVLTRRYGDYMTPPPPDQRQNHAPEAYYK